MFLWVVTAQENPVRVLFITLNLGLVLLFLATSALMRALGENRIPGVPWNLRMLLLGQTQLVSSGDAGIAQYDGGSVLDHVTRSDARREDALRELDR